MINPKAKNFCCEDLSAVENYEQAAADENSVWDCHHRLEIQLDSQGLHVASKEELIEKNLYYNRPASELVFMTEHAHMRMHALLKTPRKGFTQSDETKAKISEAMKKQYASGELVHPMLGKHHSDETKAVLSQKAKERLAGREKHPRYRADVWADEAWIVDMLKNGSTCAEVASVYKCSVKPIKAIRRLHLDELQAG